MCRAVFVARFLSTKRGSRGAIGFPHSAQMIGFGFLKNIVALPDNNTRHTKTTIVDDATPISRRDMPQSDLCRRRTFTHDV
jgi:hypothetical protein